MQQDVDTKLLAADTTLIFAYSFARTLGTVLSDPAFPGWLAPIRSDPDRLANTFNFASSWAVAWIAAALLTGAFTTGLDDGERVGLKGAALTFLAASAFWCGAALLQGALAGGGDVTLLPVPALSLSVETGEAAIGVGSCLLVWRAFLVG